MLSFYVLLCCHGASENNGNDYSVDVNMLNVCNYGEQ